MKSLRATLAALLMMAMLAFPAFAQDGKAGVGDDQQVPDNQQSGGGKEMVTKTFEFTLTGVAPEGTAFFAAYADPAMGGTEASILVFCGDPGLETGGAEPQAACEAGVYTETVEIAAGTTIEFAFVRTSPDEEEGEVFHEGGETLNADMTNEAFYTFGKGTGAGDEQETPDNQQDGEDKDSGAGDDQQDGGTGADKTPDNQQSGGGKTPDNQQGGGGETVTKTFELTLNGTVPTDRAFAVFYGTRDEFEALFESESEEPPFEYILICGQPEDAKFADTVISDEDCVGDGNTYRAEVELPQGTELFFSFATAVETDLSTAEFFHGNVGTLFETGELSGEPEVLDTDMTNTAWYTFGKGTGAGDEQETPDNQQDGEDKDSGAGDEQETPDNQQGEMPDELPDTGAGGLAGGLPLGSAAAGASLLSASGYGVIRRR